jgi:hypothetical protein
MRQLDDISRDHMRYLIRSCRYSFSLMVSNTMEFIVQMVSADVLKLAPTNCTRVQFVKTNDYNLELIVWCNARS